MKMNSRRIEFENIKNARDLGGLYTEDGHMINSGLLIRSANLAGASEADLKVLQKKYRLSKIIDLRTDTERRQMPDMIPEYAMLRPIPVFDERVAGISHEKGAGEKQLQEMIPKMETLYHMMMTKDFCRKNLGRAAEEVMEHDYTQGSVLWHCTEGKDRCGLLTAVLLLALGVDRRQIMEDYLLTNEVNGPKAEMYYQKLLAAGRAEAEAEMVKQMFLAKETYLNEAFSVIDRQYSSVNDFLCDGLNIPKEAVERFRMYVLV